MKASWANGMVLAFAAVLAITIHAARLTAAEMTEAEIKALTHGTFVLESWDLDGQPVRPPAADGRLSLHNNVVMLMARSQSGDKLHAVYGFGRYQLTGATWSYEYLNSTELKATGSRAEAGYELPWRGMRKFKLRTEGAKSSVKTMMARTTRSSLSRQALPISRTAGSCGTGKECLTDAVQNVSPLPAPAGRASSRCSVAPRP